MAGMEARMRVSSVMRPAASQPPPGRPKAAEPPSGGQRSVGGDNGTLRSARMKTRLPPAKPLAQTSEKRRNFMGKPW